MVKAKIFRFHQILSDSNEHCPRKTPEDRRIRSTPIWRSRNRKEYWIRDQNKANYRLSVTKNFIYRTTTVYHYRKTMWTNVYCWMGLWWKMEWFQPTTRKSKRQIVSSYAGEWFFRNVQLQNDLVVCVQRVRFQCLYSCATITVR